MSSPPVTAREAPSRTISPVLVTMVIVSAWGAWQLWRQNAEIVIALGPTALLGIAVWVLYGAVAVAVVVALQRFARRPLWGVALALAWGGFAATWAAGEANGALSTVLLRTAGTDPHAWLTTPVVEESLKAIGVVGLLMIPVLRRFRALDGLFYGVLVGAGFQVIEDAIYTLTALFHDPGDPVGAVFGNLIMRGLTIGLFTHAVYTGLVGAAIGWAASAPTGHRARRAVGAILVLGLMMVVHGAYNSQDGLTALVVAGALVPMAALLVVIWWARREEVRHLAQTARASEGWGTLTDEQIAVIDGARPNERAAQQAQERVRGFAWSSDHLGQHASRTQREREELRAGVR